MLGCVAEGEKEGRKAPFEVRWNGRGPDEGDGIAVMGGPVDESVPGHLGTAQGGMERRLGGLPRGCWQMR